MLLGDFEITVLTDGTVDQPVDELLTGISKDEVDSILKSSFLKSPYEVSVNCFLVNTRSKLILIDTGAGHLFGKTLGNLLTSLRASGYRPEQIDEVYLTHMHVDHLGGLTVGRQRAFPKAIVRVDKAESDYYLSDANLVNASAESKRFFQGARDAVSPYIRAGKFKPFSSDSVLAPGIRSKATHGHTPGHNIYIVESEGQSLQVWGDLLHFPEVQFPNPDVTIVYDDDPSQARAQRRAQLTNAAQTGSLVAIGHVSFPGIGHVRPWGRGFVWIPINYSVIR